MTYQRFEDLPVWQKAAELYEAREKLLTHDGFTATRGFRDQLDRAALSVSNNIAEGFERGTTNELLQFIYIARGSAGEVRSMLRVKSRQETEREKRRLEFDKMLPRHLPAWHPKRKEAEENGLI